MSSHNHTLRTTPRSPVPAPSPAPLLSRAGRAAFSAAAQGAAAHDPALATLLELAARHGDGVRALLDRLAQDMAAGDLASAAAQLHQALEPARQMDQAQGRFVAAQQAAQEALAAFGSIAGAGHHFPEATELRQLHQAAQEAASALDDLALCAHAWATLLAGEGA